VTSDCLCSWQYAVGYRAAALVRVYWLTLMYGCRRFLDRFLLVKKSSQDQWQHCCTMAWQNVEVAGYREGPLSGAECSGMSASWGWRNNQLRLAAGQTINDRECKLKSDCTIVVA
jgi:hypothetical protein